jgi:hypothetical protein
MFETLIGDDTLELAAATTLDNYNRIRRSIGKLTAAAVGQKKDLDVTRAQLMDMKTDLENEMMNELTFNEFFPSESAAVARLAEANISMLSWYQNSLSSFVKLRPVFMQRLDERRPKSP